EDLFYRLNVVPLTIPPLRKRPADIPALVAHFLDKFGAGSRTISSQAMEALVAYQWPGNVRELENTVERITILSHGEVIEADDLPAEVRAGVGIVDAGSRCFVLPEAGIDLEETELDLIRQALERAGASTPKAAKLLGLTTKTLEARMERYGL
ncbi:MAG: helix-turn-helix domain-containing protein, partial [Actinomycetota bacterium]